MIADDYKSGLVSLMLSKVQCHGQLTLLGDEISVSKLHLIFFVGHTNMHLGKAVGMKSMLY